MPVVVNLLFQILSSFSWIPFFLISPEHFIEWSQWPLTSKISLHIAYNFHSSMFSCYKVANQDQQQQKKNMTCRKPTKTTVRNHRAVRRFYCILNIYHIHRSRSIHDLYFVFYFKLWFWLAWKDPNVIFHKPEEKTINCPNLMTQSSNQNVNHMRLSF